MNNPTPLRHDRLFLRRKADIAERAYEFLCGRNRPDLMGNLRTRLSEFPLCYLKTEPNWDWPVLVFEDILQSDWEILCDFLQDNSQELFHAFFTFSYH